VTKIWDRDLLCPRGFSHFITGSMFTQLYPHNKHGGVDLKAIAAEAGACKHFCPSKWAKVRPRASEPLSPALGCVSRRVTAMPPAAARSAGYTRRRHASVTSRP